MINIPPSKTELRLLQNVYQNFTRSLSLKTLLPCHKFHNPRVVANHHQGLPQGRQYTEIRQKDIRINLKIKL